VAAAGVLRLENGSVELDVTVDGGPRVLRYAARGGRNAFHVVRGPEGPGFRLRGGHRLWVAPEDPARTYAPDEAPVAHELVAGTLHLTAPADPVFGLEKRLELTLAASGPEVTLVHRITNRGRSSQELAAWALTVLAPGGTAVVPIAPPGPHPGTAARSAEEFAPRATVSLWPFFRFDDPRLSLSDRWLELRQDPAAGPTKLGLVHRLGWAGYLNDGLWFEKRFDYVEGARYPDGGVNFETYTDARFLELESLSPLVELGPGEFLSHRETWTLAEGMSREAIARRAGLVG
jgi:hypothetical protein